MWWELKNTPGKTKVLILLFFWSTLTYGQIDSCLERLSQASQ